MLYCFGSFTVKGKECDRKFRLRIALLLIAIYNTTAPAVPFLL